MFVLCPFVVKSMSSLWVQRCFFFFSFLLVFSFFFSPNTQIHPSDGGKIHGKHLSVGLTHFFFIPVYRRKKNKANCLSFY